MAQLVKSLLNWHKDLRLHSHKNHERTCMTSHVKLLPEVGARMLELIGHWISQSALSSLRELT